MAANRYDEAKRSAEALAAEPVVAEPLTTARGAFCGSIVATRR